MSEKAINVLLIEVDADESSVPQAYPWLKAQTEGGRSSSRRPRGLRRDADSSPGSGFDVILLDLTLAQSVGIEGFRKVSAQSPETPIPFSRGSRTRRSPSKPREGAARLRRQRDLLDCCSLKRAIRHVIERKRLSREIERILDGDAAAKMVVDETDGVRYVNRAWRRPFSASTRKASADARPPSLDFRGVEPDQDPRFRLRKDRRCVGGEHRVERAPARLVSLRDASDPVRPRSSETKTSEDMRIVEIKSVSGPDLARAAKFLGHGQDRRVLPQRRLYRTVDAQAIAALGDDLAQRGPASEDHRQHLDLARFQSGKIKIVGRPVELSQIIDEISQEFRIKHKAQRLLARRSR